MHTKNFFLRAFYRYLKHIFKFFVEFNVTSLIVVAVTAIVVRVFVFQPFQIPSGSMIPSILIGDRVVVSKYAYGYTKYSFPFDQPSIGHIFSNTPRRGDIVVFRAPNGSNKDYIKRVIGIPGDRIRISGQFIYINDRKVSRSHTKDYNDQSFSFEVFEEKLPGSDKVYSVMYKKEKHTKEIRKEYLVPDGHLFVMGDNRDFSADSRFFGFVSEDSLIGRAEIIFFSINSSKKIWNIRGFFRSDRFFRGLD